MNVACCWKYCVEGELVLGLNMDVCAVSIDSKKSVKDVAGSEATAGAADEEEVEADGVTSGNGVWVVVAFGVTRGDAREWE